MAAESGVAHQFPPTPHCDFFTSQGHTVAAECCEAATLSPILEELAALSKDVGIMKTSLNKMAAKSGQWWPHVQILHEVGTLVGLLLGTAFVPEPSHSAQGCRQQK